MKITFLSTLLALSFAAYGATTTSAEEACYKAGYTEEYPDEWNKCLAEIWVPSKTNYSYMDGFCVQKTLDLFNDDARSVPHSEQPLPIQQAFIDAQKAAEDFYKSYEGIGHQKDDSVDIYGTVISGENSFGYQFWGALIGADMGGDEDLMNFYFILKEGSEPDLLLAIHQHQNPDALWFCE